MSFVSVSYCNCPSHGLAFPRLDDFSGSEARGKGNPAAIAGLTQSAPAALSFCGSDGYLYRDGILSRRPVVLGFG